MYSSLQIVTGHVHEWNNECQVFIFNVEHSYDEIVVLPDSHKH